jgi:hypothetical protein
MSGIRSVLENLLAFSPQNVTPYAWVPLIVIWVVVAGVLIADIFQNSKSVFRSLLWSFIVLLLPVISGVFYSLVCLFKDHRPSSAGSWING